MRLAASALTGSIVALVAGLSYIAPAPAAQTRPPNIIFILADDLGVNDLGVYGRKEHRTPHLDRLAAEGLRFTTAYVASPICSPSRAALMTGRAPARLHLTTYIPGRPDTPSQKLLHPPMRQQLPLEETTVAERLRAAGYATAMIGKWHLGGTGFMPRDQGFDVEHAGQATTKPSETEGGKGEYDLTSQAERFIDANRERPFFLYLAHNNPHIPFLSARPALVTANAGAFEPAYAATLQTLDDSVGRLLAHLDATGLRERTVVIFTSDNGGLHVPEGPHPRVTHNTPFRAGKGYLYEGGLRVPLIVRGPGIPAGRVVDAPVLNSDWLPTLLDLAGAPAAPNLDGVSQMNVLRTGKPASTARTFFWHIPHYTNQGSRPAGAVQGWPMEAGRTLRQRPGGTVRSRRRCERKPRSVEGRGWTDRCLATAAARVASLGGGAREHAESWRGRQPLRPAVRRVRSDTLRSASRRQPGVAGRGTVAAADERRRQTGGGTEVSPKGSRLSVVRTTAACQEQQRRTGFLLIS